MGSGEWEMGNGGWGMGKEIKNGVGSRGKAKGKNKSKIQNPKSFA
jgi:hypothetical protein